MVRTALSWKSLVTREVKAKRRKRVTEFWREPEVSVEMKKAEPDVHVDRKKAACTRRRKSRGRSWNERRNVLSSWNRSSSAREKSRNAQQSG